MPNLNHFYNSFSPFQYVGSLAFSFHFLLFVMIFLISNCGFFFFFFYLLFALVLFIQWVDWITLFVVVAIASALLLLWRRPARIKEKSKQNNNKKQILFLHFHLKKNTFIFLIFHRSLSSYWMRVWVKEKLFILNYFLLHLNLLFHNLFKVLLQRYTTEFIAFVFYLIALLPPIRKINNLKKLCFFPFHFCCGCSFFFYFYCVFLLPFPGFYSIFFLYFQ